MFTTANSWRRGAAKLKIGFRNLKFLFSKIVKGATNICCVKNRHFKRSESVSNFFQLEIPPLTFYQNKSAILSIFQLHNYLYFTWNYKKIIKSHKSLNLQDYSKPLNIRFHEIFYKEEN